MTFEEWSGKVQPGDWIAFKKGSGDLAVAYADSYESIVKKVKKLRKEGRVVYSQVPPSNCSLIL
jgi:hypothetical protein